ncbi:APC family permease [Acidianus sp. HS-5]|uniref:APC family permease n=1 Tax=Acidianus sp. HS-5 TaxID=2886040 RepID=UPI001F443332|nr:APC family permease [Acidianus sp. HS-5]BDC18913.1 amino acid permease [Acidianus sp. HS-5]
MSLRKVLTKKELTFLSLGGIIGSGWLFAPLAAAAYAGPLSIASWIIGGLMMIIIALAYAEISSALPESGGIIRYPHYTHGSTLGFIMAWSYIISAISTVAIEAVATTTYISHFFPTLTSGNQLTLEGIVVTYALLIIFFLVNYYGVKFLGRVSHGIGWWKIIIPTTTAVILLAYFNPANVVFGKTACYQGFNGMLYAIPESGIVFSYLGFRQAIEYGGEGRNPQKDIPFAVISSLLISMAIFISLQLGFLGVVKTDGNWAGLLNSPLANAPLISVIEMLPIVFSFWVGILLFDAIISPAGTGIIYLGTTTRSFYASAKSGYFPSNLTKINEKGIPIFALIISLIASALFLLPIPSWYQIVGISSSATVLTYIMGGIGVETMRRIAPNIKRSYLLSNLRILAPLATIFAGLLIYWSGFSTLFYIFTLVILGLSAYKRGVTGILSGVITLLNSYELYVETSALTSASWYFIPFIIIDTLVLTFLILTSEEGKFSAWAIPLLSGTLILSYISPFGLYDVIPFPYDLIVTSVFFFIIHKIAVKSSLPALKVESPVNS